MKKQTKKLQLNKFAVAKLTNINTVRGGGASCPGEWCPPPVPNPIPPTPSELGICFSEDLPCTTDGPPPLPPRNMAF